MLSVFSSEFSITARKYRKLATLLRRIQDDPEGNSLESIYIDA